MTAECCCEIHTEKLGACSGCPIHGLNKLLSPETLAQPLFGDDWPDPMEMIRQLRRACGLFDGAMPLSPRQAWEEALITVQGRFT